MSAHRGGDVTFRVPRESAVDPECTSLACEASATATEPAVVTAFVLLGLATLIAFAYVREAKTCCRRERRRVTDERDAFEEFAGRIASIDPVPAEATRAPDDGPVVGARLTGSVGVAGAANEPNDTRLRRVLDAYRDTVVSLPHYTEEYDETVAESLAAELGPDTTTSLASNGTLSPGLRSALIERSRKAARARATLADAIDAELDDLDDAEARLTRIDRQRDRLNEHLEGVPSGARADASIDVWERLNGLEGKCDAAAAARQESLRDPPIPPEVGSTDGVDPSFNEYLYGSTDGPRYPVLASIASLAERIRTDRERAVRRIAEVG